VGNLLPLNYGVVLLTVLCKRGPDRRAKRRMYLILHKIKALTTPWQLVAINADDVLEYLMRLRK
jgi:hypothetical protein